MKQAVARKSKAEMTKMYETMEGMIEGICCAYARKKGGEVDEHKQNASVSFCKAAHTFDPEKGSLDRRIAARVMLDFKSEERTEARRKRLRQAHLISSSEDSCCFLEPVILTDDAAEIQRMLCQQAGSTMSQEKAKKIKNLVKRTLRQRGWGIGRIICGFYDLKKALS